MSKILLLCGALAWTAQATSVTLTTNPTSLTFTYQIGATKLPSAQTISLRINTGTPVFTATTPAPDEWLTVDPSSGTVPATLNVRVNPTSLPASIYNSSVTVTVTGLAPVAIPVSLVVSPPAPTLSVSATTLTFNAPPYPPAAQNVSLTTNGEPISFTATSGATWMTVSPTVGVVLPGPGATLTVSVNTGNLAPQTAAYTGKITLALTGASTKSQNITVNLTISSSAPTITSIWPNNLPLNGPAQTITIIGTNFYSASVVEVQGVSTPLATTVYKDSSTVLQAVVPANLLTTAGTLEVTVVNPAPGGASAASPVTVASSPTILGIVNSASFVSGAVSPGEIVTLFGTNIGPATPASMTVTNGFVDTTLGTVSVTIDGKNCPMVYVSQNQISVQVPYEVSIGPGKAVVVTYGTATANTTVTTAATAPGIFTVNGTGTGQAAALNYDSSSGAYTLNSGSNLAKIGEIVVLYLTGEGIYLSSPLSGGPSDTGYIVPNPLNNPPTMNPAPTVSIGGQNVDTTNPAFYAGPIPGSMMGLLQINAVVPTGATTGTAVPVVVTIGGNSTQANVTLGIHP